MKRRRVYPWMSLPRDAAGGVCSLGRVLLLAKLQTRTEKDVAAICGVDQSTISRLASGAHVTDSYELRFALQRHLGIAHNAWDMPAETPPDHRPDHFMHACIPGAATHDESDADSAA